MLQNTNDCQARYYAMHGDNNGEQDRKLYTFISIWSDRVDRITND